MVSARMKDIGAALGRLDPVGRALLDLSLHRGMPDEDIADVLNTDPGEIGRRREELLGRLADDLRLDGRAQRDELRATLPDLPPEIWKSR